MRRVRRDEATLSSHQRTLNDAHAPVGVCVVNDRRRWCRSRVELLSCGVFEETKFSARRREGVAARSQMSSTPVAVAANRWRKQRNPG